MGRSCSGSNESEGGGEVMVRLEGGRGRAEAGKVWVASFPHPVSVKAVAWGQGATGEPCHQ